MAIDFTKLASAGAHAQTLDFTKAKVIETGERLNFSKDNISNVRVELYWESDQDADVSVLLLGENGTCAPADLVYYANLEAKGVLHSGDNRGDTDGDPSTPEETITVNLLGLENHVSEVLVVASTYSDGAPITLGRFKDIRMLLINADTNEVLYAYELDEDFSTFTSVEAASFYKKGDEWRFKSIGEGLGKGAKAMSDVGAKYIA